MQSQEYICLACGNFYRDVREVLDDAGSRHCPRCRSANVMKLTSSGSLGSLSGGG